jgi:hypothetical protein
MIARMTSFGKLGLSLSAAFVFAISGACGGAITSIDDAGTDGATGNDGSTTSDACIGTNCTNPPPNGCPTSPPANASACTEAQDQLKCEYGTNPEPDCNQMFFCNQGHWQDQSSGTICAPQSQCPASYAAVPANQVCSPVDFSCAYPQGECICSMGEGVVKQNPTWECLPAVSGCPSPRADLGTSCDVPDQQCDYGSCSGGLAEECKDGIWIEVFTPCPG